MRKQKPTQAEGYNGNMFYNPNVNTHFWKERVGNEDNHKYRSIVKGVYLGRVNNVPVTDDFASRVTQPEVSDPIHIAHRINSEEKYKKDKFPMKRLFGSNRANKRLILPVEAREFHNISQKISDGKSMNRYKASIKTYDEQNRMHWMGSSINLSQPEIKRFIFDTHSQRSVPDLKTSPRAHRQESDTMPQSKLQNYRQLNTSARQNHSIDVTSSRRSHILQSSGAQKFTESQNRGGLNKSVMHGAVNTSIDRSHLPTFAQNTLRNPQSIYNSPGKRISLNQSLKERYNSQAGYISHPLNQVRVPEISTLKANF